MDASQICCFSVSISDAVVLNNVNIMSSLIAPKVVDPFIDLASSPKGICVSIFMPNYAGKLKKLSRFKNLLRQTEELLGANGRSAEFAAELLQPAAVLPSQISFWQRSGGIALFLSKGMFHYYHLPLVFEEIVVVSDQFYLDPLSSLIKGSMSKASALN